MTVGIVSTGIYLPQNKMTSQDIAALQIFQRTLSVKKWVFMKSQSLVSMIIPCKWAYGQHRMR